MAGKKNSAGPPLYLFSVIGMLLLFFPSAWAQTTPTITRQPLSQSILAGAAASLGIEVAGSGPFTS